MLYDLGFTDTGKFRQYTDRYVAPEDQLEFCALMFTPGMPTDYVLHVVGLRRWQKQYALDLAESWRDICQPLGVENAGTITVEDGYAMWRPMLRRGYNNTVPHWTSLALETLMKTGQKTAETVMSELRVSQSHIANLRRSKFHPITLQRQSMSGRPGRSLQLEF